MEGQTLSHYRVLEKLGGGGMGVVYKALDTKLNRHVALKFLPPELTRDDDARERFILEAQAASALDHPHICTIYEIDETSDGQMFIAMAFYDGETLKKRIERGLLSIDEAQAISTQIAEGLSKAHSSGIVHRDIKPANIMLTSDGLVKIVDFGIAKLLGVTGPTQPGTTVGTVAYMAPEQVNGEKVDQQTDVWALGAVLYEMLTGRVPFEGDQPAVVLNAIVQRPLKRPSTLRPEIDRGLDRRVAKALEKNRTARYQTVREFLADRSTEETVVLTTPPVDPRASSVLSSWLSPSVFVPVLVGLAVLAGGAYWFAGGSAEQVARTETLPRIDALLDEDRYLEAYALAEEAEQLLGDDATLAEFWPRMSVAASVITDPPGATVSFRAYDGGVTEWHEVGVTPLEWTRLPLGIFSLQVELEGFEPRLLTVQNPSYSMGNFGRPATVFPLTPVENGLSGMVAVPGTSVGGTDQGMITGNDPIAPIPLGDFFIDVHETTNLQFKAFIDAGGYETEEYWHHPFIGSGGELSWDQAMTELVDATGRPGPSTWELGTYPEGAADLPVTGVSWYEAAAYAAFSGKSLPTIYHWATASGRELASQIVGASNFGTDAPVPVGESGGVGPYGTLGMAGNVREWCFNASGDDRWILGGAWGDPVYLFTYANVQSPFDRSETNGFRLVAYVGDTEPSGDSTLPIRLSERDYYSETPVNDEVFDVYREQFSYDRTDLDAVVESRDETSKPWTMEVVSFNAAYDDERMKAILFLPRGTAPPYHTVVLFPGSGALSFPSSVAIGEGAASSFFDFLLSSGRAVILPILKGTFERNDGLTSAWANSTVRYADYLVKWVQDTQRTIDYLQTREELDTDRLAYYGLSWGARMGAIIPAVEPRFTTAILSLGGLASGRARPEVDQINYITRVTLPVLMLNGRFDAVEPLETSQLPMFELLGTPVEDKRHVLFDTDHEIPRNAGIREMLDWLDMYLGPVN